MKLAELFLPELDREVPRSRRALEQVPGGKRDWKPHPGPARRRAEGGQQFRPPESQSSHEFVRALEQASADTRAALQGTDDEFLKTPWQLLAGGEVVADRQRHEMLRETINHWAHHRGQMTFA